MAQTTISIDKYTLLADAYQGANGFMDGTYLFQHKRERQGNFDTRKSIAYFLNYTKPTVNSHVDPIFRKEPARSVKDDIASAFLEDVDGAGTSMSEFMKNACFQGKLKGVSFVVVDNAPENQKAPTLAVAKEKRQFPYCYVVPADRISKWSLDKFGNLNYIAYTEPLLTDKNDPNTLTASDIASTIKDSAGTTENQYRIWTRTEWAVCDKDGGILSSGTHGLGRVPVCPFFGGDRVDGQLLIESDFYGIAKTNLRVYNLCSELDEILRNQAFAILTYPHKEATQLLIGINNALGYNGAEVRYPPQFIAPPFAPAEMLMNHLDRLIQEMYRMAMLTHQTAGTNESRTGAAKEWDYEATNKVLASTAGSCCTTEYDIMRVFALYMKKDITALEFNSRYSRDFSIRDTQQELKDAAAALALQAGQLFDIEVKKKAAMVYLRDVPDADLQSVINDIIASKAVTDQASTTLGEGTDATGTNNNVPPTTLTDDSTAK